MRLLVRRLAEAAVLLWLVVTLTFVLLRLAPGDPATLLIPPSATAADIARSRARLGLDAPIAVQYVRWAGRVLHGDLGESFAYHRPVRTVLAAALPVSLGLGGASLVLSFVLGVAVGTWQGVVRGTRTDTTLTVLTTAMYAAPSFWLALALVAAFTWGAVQWGFPAFLRLPAFGVHDPAGTLHGLDAVADVVRHAVLPVVTLTALGAAGVARYARSVVADVAGQPYVRTGRAKGLGPAALYGRHVVRNAIAPLVVLFALTLPGVLAGSVFVETVFAWPGMGRLMVSAISARDYPVIMGAATLYAAMVILANLAADLVLPLLDPQRRRA